MQISKISKFNDTTIVTTTCPHCGSRQMHSSMLVCAYCYEALHDVVDLFNNVKARISCFEQEDPWEYQNGHYT